MPCNLQLPKLAAAGQTLRQAIDDSAGLDVRRLSAVSIKKDIGGLQAVLGVLRDERWITANVAAGIRVPGYTKRNQGAANSRQPFSRAMMTTLFASPMFTGCAGQAIALRSRPGTSVFQDALYWITLLGVVGSPRLEELGQALVQDVETIDLALGTKARKPMLRTVIRITGGGSDQHLKTAGSKRPLIVHPRLIELGFADYVAARRASGAERLFNLTRSANEKWTKEASRQLNRYLDATVTSDPHYVFYSLRHEWKDRASDSGIDTRNSETITGHAPPTVGGNYGRGASLYKLGREIDKLDVSFIDWARLAVAAGR